MLRITSDLLVGKGLHREVFVHPDDPSKCIKIDVAGHGAEAAREAAYYRVLRKRGVPFTMLAGYHGYVDTDRGEGTVFDLIRDADGQVSRTLEYYLEDADELERNLDGLLEALPRLHAYLLEWKVLTMNIKPKNLVYAKGCDGEGRLVVVDNIGNSDFLPLCTHIGALASRKIQRKWSRFMASLSRDYGDKENLQRVLPLNFG